MTPHGSTPHGVTPSGSLSTRGGAAATPAPLDGASPWPQPPPSWSKDTAKGVWSAPSPQRQPGPSRLAEQREVQVRGAAASPQEPGLASLIANLGIGRSQPAEPMRPACATHGEQVPHALHGVRQPERLGVAMPVSPERNWGDRPIRGLHTSDASMINFDSPNSDSEASDASMLNFDSQYSDDSPRQVVHGAVKRRTKHHMPRRDEEIQAGSCQRPLPPDPESNEQSGLAVLSGVHDEQRSGLIPPSDVNDGGSFLHREEKEPAIVALDHTQSSVHPQLDLEEDAPQSLVCGEGDDDGAEGGTSSHLPGRQVIGDPQPLDVQAEGLFLPSSGVDLLARSADSDRDGGDIIEQPASSAPHASSTTRARLSDSELPEEKYGGIHGGAANGTHANDGGTGIDDIVERLSDGGGSGCLLPAASDAIIGDMALATPASVDGTGVNREASVTSSPSARAASPSIQRGEDAQVAVRGTMRSLNSDTSSAGTSPLSSPQSSPHASKPPKAQASGYEDLPPPPLPALDAPVAPPQPAAQLQQLEPQPASDVPLASGGSSSPTKPSGGGGDDFDLLGAVQGAESDGSSSTSESEKEESDGSL